MSVTLNGDVLVDWRRWRLPRVTTRIHGQEQRGDGDGGDGDHVVPDAGRSVSHTARAGSAGGKRSSERHGRTVER